jgi:hypothetical protein
MGMNVHADRLSLAFAALADPTRRAILARLASGDADVSELMKPFALTGWSPFAASGSRNLPAWILT